jgi:hypothetical protein
LDRSAGVLALVLQHPLELAPTGIEHGLCHPRLRQLRAAHIAHDNALIPIDDPAAETVQGISPSVRRSSMPALGLAPVTPTLRLGNLLLEVAVEIARLELFPRAGHRGVLHAEVNTDGLLGGHLALDGDLHRQAQPPVADRVLRKAALLPLHPVQPLRLERAEGLATEAQRLPFALETRADFTFLNWRRRAAYSRFTRWIVSAPT